MIDIINIININMISHIIVLLFVIFMLILSFVKLIYVFIYVLIIIHNCDISIMRINYDIFNLTYCPYCYILTKQKKIIVYLIVCHYLNKI